MPQKVFKKFNNSIAYLMLLSPVGAVALSGGKATNPLSLPSVVQMNITDDASETSFCTATKIGARKYLTAAHCFSLPETGEAKNIASLRISHGNSIKNSFSQMLTIRKIHLNPYWEKQIDRQIFRDLEERLLSGTDQAVIEVEDENSLPILEVDFAPVKEGDVIYAAGYGIQSVRPGTYLPQGQLRVTQKRVTNSVFQANVVSVGPADQNGSTFSQFAPGDSGGPILRIIKSPKLPYRAQVKVVGIMSFITDLIYVDPDTGLPIVVAEDSYPASYFVRTQKLSNLKIDLDPWLKVVTNRFKFTN